MRAQVLDRASGLRATFWQPVAKGLLYFAFQIPLDFDFGYPSGIQGLDRDPYGRDSPNNNAGSPEDLASHLVLNPMPQRTSALVRASAEDDDEILLRLEMEEMVRRQQRETWELQAKLQGLMGNAGGMSREVASEGPGVRAAAARAADATAAAEAAERALAAQERALAATLAAPPEPRPARHLAAIESFARGGSEEDERGVGLSYSVTRSPRPQTPPASSPRERVHERQSRASDHTSSSRGPVADTWGCQPSLLLGSSVLGTSPNPTATPSSSSIYSLPNSPDASLLTSPMHTAHEAAPPPPLPAALCAERAPPRPDNDEAPTELLARPSEALPRPVAAFAPPPPPTAVAYRSRPPQPPTASRRGTPPHGRPAPGEALSRAQPRGGRSQSPSGRSRSPGGSSPKAPLRSLADRGRPRSSIGSRSPKSSSRSGGGRSPKSSSASAGGRSPKASPHAAAAVAHGGRLNAHVSPASQLPLPPVIAALPPRTIAFTSCSH